MAKAAEELMNQGPSQARFGFASALVLAFTPKRIIYIHIYILYIYILATDDRFTFGPAHTYKLFGQLPRWQVVKDDDLRTPCGRQVLAQEAFHLDSFQQLIPSSPFSSGPRLNGQAQASQPSADTSAFGGRKSCHVQHFKSN